MSKQIPVTVCLWRDAGGLLGGCLAEWPDIVALGQDQREVLSQLQAYVDWQAEEQPWRFYPDFLIPELRLFKIEVYPEYRVAEKIYPGSDPLLLRVPCLTGQTRMGQMMVSLPLQRLLFHCQEPAALEKLVKHFVQQALRGQTTQQLSRQLSPPQLWLESVVYKQRDLDRFYADDTAPENLSQVAEPFGDKASRRQFGRAWEREGLLRDLTNWLLTEKTPILLVGEPGVGKTTLLAEAVREAERKQNRQQSLSQGFESDAQAKTPRFWLTNAGRLIAGMPYLGQWEKRCEALISELSGLRGTLCIENLSSLLRVGGSGPGNSLAAFFLPFLQYGELRLIAEATPAELDACRRILPGFVDSFRILNVPPMDSASTLRVMERLQRMYQQEGGPEVERGTLEQINYLFRRFAPYRSFPGQPVRFLQQLLEVYTRHAFNQLKPQKLSSLDVVRLFSERTGLPEPFLRDDWPLAYSEVLRTLQARVLGQDAACESAARVLTMFKAGLNDPQRPLGVLLFCGPTGVGKTELAKAMADFLLGAAQQADHHSAHSAGTERLIRLDMSEYSGPFAGTRLLTGPDGRPADWLQRIRQQPFQLLLFDEVEKASPEVFDVLLGLFDEGRLTDSYGQLLHFQSCLIVMTSNLGADGPANLGFSGRQSSTDSRYAKAVQDFFRPEFFNRLDAVVPFKALGEAEVLQIAEQELNKLAQREGLQQAQLKLSWTPAVAEHLASVGFDARYGARPLQRALESEVAAPLAHFLLAQSGLEQSEILIDIHDHQLLIRLA